MMKIERKIMLKSECVAILKMIFRLKCNYEYKK